MGLTFKAKGGGKSGLLSTTSPTSQTSVRADSGAISLCHAKLTRGPLVFTKKYRCFHLISISHQTKSEKSQAALTRLEVPFGPFECMPHA